MKAATPVARSMSASSRLQTWLQNRENVARVMVVAYWASTVMLVIGGFVIILYYLGKWRA